MSRCGVVDPGEIHRNVSALMTLLFQLSLTHQGFWRRKLCLEDPAAWGWAGAYPSTRSGCLTSTWTWKSNSRLLRVINGVDNQWVPINPLWSPMVAGGVCVFVCVCVWSRICKACVLLDICQILVSRVKQTRPLDQCRLLHGTRYCAQIRVRHQQSPWSEWSSSQCGVTLETGGGHDQFSVPQSVTPTFPNLSPFLPFSALFNIC